MQEQKTRKVDETDFGKQLKDVLEDWAQATIATHGVELIDGEETELHLALPLRVKVRAEKGDGEPGPKMPRRIICCVCVVHEPTGDVTCIEYGCC
jgi:hypothetical protein